MLSRLLTAAAVSGLLPDVLARPRSQQTHCAEQPPTPPPHTPTPPTPPTPPAQAPPPDPVASPAVCLLCAQYNTAWQQLQWASREKRCRSHRECIFAGPVLTGQCIKNPDYVYVVSADDAKAGTGGGNRAAWSPPAQSLYPQPLPSPPPLSQQQQQLQRNTPTPPNLPTPTPYPMPPHMPTPLPSIQHFASDIVNDQITSTFKVSYLYPYP